MARSPNGRNGMVDLKVMQAGQCRHLECIAFRGGRLRLVPFPALYFLLVHPTHGPCLIDTGYSNNIHDALGEFPYSLYGRFLPVDISSEETAVNRLRCIGIKPQDVRHIVITHFHVDHVGGLRDFPNATYWSSMFAWSSVRQLRGVRALLNGFFPSMVPKDFEERFRAIESLSSTTLTSDIAALGKGFDLFGDDSIVLVPLPGHACGQYGAVVRTADGVQTLIVADACWASKAIREHRMPSMIAYPFMDQVRDYRRTLHALHSIYKADSGIRILPSHCTEVAKLSEVRNA